MIKNKEQEDKVNEFTDLAPVDDIENGEEYLKALHWAITNKKVKNIALAGPYGAGKSSIIETYLKKYTNIERKALRISMATFIENETDENGNPKKISLEQDEIELGILKQLFYKVNYKKIPQSRYRKLHKINWKRIWINLIAAFIIFGLIAFIFFPDTFGAAIEKIDTAGQQFGLNGMLSKGIFIAFSLGILAVIARIYRSILFRFKVDEVKLPTETVVKGSDSATETVFNKNMDEIVYFFEETDYRIVFFEDLDRLENPSIFIHLRELNMLLNNYEGIKGRIVFVYAIRDDIFTDTDRTKFFDFIIPVIPIINSTNSGETFLQKLNESKDKGIIHEISQGFILDVAPYVEDMRILQNVYNEFIIYKKTIRTGQELKLSDEAMMALIIFKNLYPKDFAELQMERGIVKQAFEDKQQCIATQSAKWQEEINQYSNVLELYHRDSLDKIRELKVSMLSSLVKWQGIVINIQVNYYNTISASKIVSDSFDFSELLTIKNCSINYYTWTGVNTSITLADLKKAIQPYYERICAFQVVQEKGLCELQYEIEDLKNKIHKLSGWSLKKLVEEFDVQEVLSENVRKNKLLVFMLRRGYIDEKYANYINYFKGTSITKEDMNFILALKNMEKLPYSYNLTKVSMVVQRLQIYEFEQKSIYNFNLLEYLLSVDEEVAKLNALITQLSDGTEESWSFINEFIDRTQYKEKFIGLLASSWEDIWNYISENITLTYERKIFFFRLLVNNISIERLVELNRDKELKAFMEDNPDILQQLSSINAQKLISLIKSLEITFKNILIENVSEEVLRYVFDNQCYELNIIMIRRIVEFNNSVAISKLYTQNYTTIVKLGYEPLIKFVRENIKSYVKTIVLAQENVKEEVVQIMDLLVRCIDDSEICLQLIEHEEFCLDNILECCGELGRESDKEVKILWDELLKKSKVKLSWENIEHYWKRHGLSSELLRYIEKNNRKLETLEGQCTDENFVKAFIVSSVEETVFENLLPKLKLDNFDIPFEHISEPKLKVMIKHRYFPFDVVKYDEIRNLYPNLCSEYILYNQKEYIPVITDIPMEETLLEKLLISPLLDLPNTEILLETFGKDYMTSTIAESLLGLNVPINITLFDAAWSYLDEKGKNNLMFKCLSVLDATKFEHCFSDLSKRYPKFSDRTKKHNVELANTEGNRELVERLKAVSYITSFTEQKKEAYDSVTGTGELKSIISCWIKAVKPKNK